MTTDTSRTLEIAGSPGKLLGLVGIGVLMTAASGWVALLPGPSSNIVPLVGYLGIAFFGLATGVAFWRLLTAREPVVTIAPEGIRDSRVAAEVIPWSVVTGISTWEFRRQKVMVLAISPGVEERLGLTRMAQWTRGANRALGADGLCITAAGLKIDHATLLQTSLDYAEAYRRRLQVSSGSRPN